MTISLENIGKKYSHRWIFRNIDLNIHSPQHFGILGSNGSGKSTLLKIICGILQPSEGKIHWKAEGKDISEEIFKYIGISSPHLELIEEFTLEELLGFHHKFKPFINNFSTKDIIRISGLANITDKPIRSYSSGMKQRVKLLLTLLSQNQLVLLDEPCTNLDQNSISWYQQLIREYAGNRILIIASNDEKTECFSCSSFFKI